MKELSIIEQTVKEQMLEIYLRGLHEGSAMVIRCMQTSELLSEDQCDRLKTVAAEEIINARKRYFGEFSC